MAKSEKKPKKQSKKKPISRDKFVLYEAAVQCVEVEIDFMESTYKKKNGRSFHLFREDFCAAAAMCCEFVSRGDDNHAFGVDIDQPTLEWGRKHNLPALGDASDRVTLFNADVLTIRAPKVDVVAALNFSYWVFKERALLTRYFRGVRESLHDDGFLVLDVFGGTDSMAVIEEERKIKDATGKDGEPIANFTYVWEQAYFNPITHDIRCHIHFKLGDGKLMKKAFTYEWRLWTVPELREMLLEAGFGTVEIWNDGWDKKLDEPDGHYKKKTYFFNDPGWLVYVVAHP